MAADVLANIANALARTFAPDIVMQFNREAVTAKLLSVKDDQGYGDAKEVAWDVSFSGATAAAFAEGSDVGASEFNQDTDINAILSWGMYRAPFQLSNLEINAASRAVGSADKLRSIVTHRLFGSMTKMASVINADLWTGTGTASNGNPNIIGFTGTAGTWNGSLISSGSYAGLATGTYSEWASNLFTNGGVSRPLSFALLSQAERQIYLNSGERPDVMVGSVGVLSKYEGLFESQKMYNSNEGGGVSQYRGSVTAGMEGMKTSLAWRDTPMYRDRNAPTGVLLMLNSSNLELKFLPFNPLSPDGVPVQTMTLPSSNGKATTPTPLMANIYPLARTGSAIKFNVEMYVQLAVKRPNSCALIGDLSEV